MGSAEIAKTTDEMEAEMDAVIDAENGNVMDAKTTAEITHEKYAEILEIETRVPPMSGEVHPPHLDSPRVRVTRMKNAESYPAKTRTGQSADHVNGDHPLIPERSPGTDPPETTDTPTAEISSTVVIMTTGQLNAQTKARPIETARPSLKQSRRVPPVLILPASREKAAVAEHGNSG